MVNHQGAFFTELMLFWYFSFDPVPAGVPFLITAELFKQSHRPAAYIVGGSLNWLSNFTVGFVFPFLQVKAKCCVALNEHFSVLKVIPLVIQASKSDRWHPCLIVCYKSSVFLRKLPAKTACSFCDPWTSHSFLNNCRAACKMKQCSKHTVLNVFYLSQYRKLFWEFWDE